MDPGLRLVYEKHVDSLSALKRELGLLDEDAGVRVVGKYEGVRCFAFVTRFGTTYAVLVYSTKGGVARSPHERLASKEFTEVADVVAFLKSIAVPKVDAYVY